MSDTPEPDAADSCAHDEQLRHPNPPSMDGRCDRCGWRGKVYPGRYGGYRCAVCFGLQWGGCPARKSKCVADLHARYGQASALVVLALDRVRVFMLAALRLSSLAEWRSTRESVVCTR